MNAELSIMFRLMFKVCVCVCVCVCVGLRVGVSEISADTGVHLRQAAHTEASLRSS